MRRLLKSWQDGWREGPRESESGLDRNDEHRASLGYKMEAGEEQGGGANVMWQREIYGKRKLERGREGGGGWGGVNM